ncbi:MAG: TerB family tellurite resistance protein [Gammaproteobacteria bacterium]|nr:TerB family tellurite resistance protein [Gammaproteobacteria bacterium]
MLVTIKQFFTSYLVVEVTGDQQEGDRLQLAAAVLLVEMMRMDDVIKEEERGKVHEIIVREFGLSDESASELIELAEQELSDATDYFQFTSLINKSYTMEQKTKLVESLWRVAMSDDILCKYEEHMVRKISELLYVPHRSFIAAKHRVMDG